MRSTTREDLNYLNEHVQKTAGEKRDTTQGKRDKKDNVKDKVSIRGHTPQCCWFDLTP